MIFKDCGFCLQSIKNIDGSKPNYVDLVPLSLYWNVERVEKLKEWYPDIDDEDVAKLQALPAVIGNIWQNPELPEVK